MKVANGFRDRERRGADAGGGADELENGAVESLFCPDAGGGADELKNGAGTPYEKN